MRAPKGGLAGPVNAVVAHVSRRIFVWVYHIEHIGNSTSRKHSTMSLKEKLRLIKALGSRKIRDIRVSTPIPTADRGGLAVVCIVRNVAKDIAEWIEFHRRAGVEHFIVYDNGSTDDLETVLFPYTDAGIVRTLPWNLSGQDADTGRHITAQATAYAHAITTFGSHFERIAFIDIDEFLVPKCAPTLMECIAKAGSPSNMSLPWHMFGHSGHATRPEGGVVQNYTQRAVLPYSRPDLLLRYKCIVDPCMVTIVSVHYFETKDMDDRTTNAVGTSVSHSERKKGTFFTSEGIQLNHYYCQSKSEMKEKIERGAVSFASHKVYRDRVISKVQEIERATVSDRCAVEFMSDVQSRYVPEH